MKANSNSGYSQLRSTLGTLVFGLTAMIAFTFVACSSNNGGTSAAIPVPATTTAISGNPDNCQVGQIDAPGYGCLSQMSCPANEGWTGTVCVPGTLISSTTGTSGFGKYFSTLAITNQNQFQLLLKYASLCDPYWVGINFGSYSCANWSSSGFMQLQVLAGASAKTTNIQMVVGAGNVYSSQMPGWQTLLPSSQSQQYISFSTTATQVAYNNSQGMQIIAVANGQDQGLRLVVPTGQFGTNTTIQGTLRYQNIDFATVNLQPIQ